MESTLCRTYFKFIWLDLDSTFALGLKCWEWAEKMEVRAVSAKETGSLKDRFTESVTEIGVTFDFH